MAKPKAAATATPRPSGDLLKVESLDLNDEISEWIYRNEDASFSAVIAQANLLLEKIGFPFLLDVSALSQKSKEKFVLQTKDSHLELPLSDPSLVTDLCGEKYVKVNAMLESGGRASLQAAGKKHFFSLQPYRLDTVLVGRNTFTLPEPTEPIGLAPDGKSIYLPFFLSESLSRVWWNHAGIEAEQAPFLILKVEPNHLSFSADPNAYRSQDFQVLTSQNGLLRWKFSPSGLIANIRSHCPHHH